MLDRERALLENMQKLANQGELNADLPAFDLAVNDSLRRIGLLNDQLKRIIQNYKLAKRFDPPAPDIDTRPSLSPSESHAQVEYLRQALRLPPIQTPTFDADRLFGVEDNLFRPDSPYDLNDPKHPTYRERMIDAADNERDNIPDPVDIRIGISRNAKDMLQYSCTLCGYKTFVLDDISDHVVVDLHNS